ncbi:MULTISPECIES: lysozyme inhibitor LprI family protein [unclassified Mesorhizobium]|nr:MULTISPECIES: lysozyme inhibitor LprI family protein [unclassified Mesorhizobium]
MEFWAAGGSPFLMRWAFFSAWLAFALISGRAAAADIQLIDSNGTVDIIGVSGEIVQGDADRFYDLTLNRGRVLVLLQSPGGLIEEALQIGARIRLSSYVTSVGADGECYSACGLIWVAGVRRYMSPTSKIGFHAAYTEENGQYKESGVANAEVGSYLTHLGLRIEAIRFFTIAGPTEVRLLSSESARALGIDVFEQDSGQLSTPSDAPTADVFADRFVSYTLLQSRCAEFFQPDKDVIDRAVREAFDEGNRIAGKENWIGLWTPMLDEVKSALKSRGALFVCLETVAFMADHQQPTGIGSPSFDCSKAMTATENAVCSDDHLWAKDRAMNAIYRYIRGFNNVNVRKSLLANQREWLQHRNACGGSRACLNRSYDDRFQLMKDIDVSVPVNGQ